MRVQTLFSALSRLKLSNLGAEIRGIYFTSSIDQLRNRSKNYHNALMDSLPFTAGFFLIIQEEKLCCYLQYLSTTHLGRFLVERG